MDVKDFLRNPIFDSDVKVTGWIVDMADGLFIVGDHFPEDYDYPHRLKILNHNVMYQILRVIPSLGGGRSLLFYKVRATGKLKRDPLGMFVENLSIQEGRVSSDFLLIKFDEELTDGFVRDFGDYNFQKVKGPMRDWLGD